MQRLRLVLLTLILFICVITSVTSFAQVAHNFCATDQACSWGALNTFSAGISLPSLPNGCLSTTSGLVNSQACGLPLTGGTLTGLLNGTIFTASTVITAPQFCIGNSCITAWPASSAPAGTNSLQYSNGAGTALLALPNAPAGSVLASTSATTPYAPQTKLNLDVRDFWWAGTGGPGTVCTGSDDTAALAAAWAVCSGTGWNGSSWGSPTCSAKLQLPSSNCNTSETLTYNGSNAYSIEIAGQLPTESLSGSQITYTGPASGNPVIYLNSAVRSKLHDFTILGGNALYGIQLDAYNVTHSGAPGNHDNVFDNLTIYMGGAITGSTAVVEGHTGCVSEQISDNEIDLPWFAGDYNTSQVGFTNLCGGNVKNLIVKGGSIVAFGTGINYNNVGGSFEDDGTIFLDNLVTDFALSGGPGTFTISNVRSEGGTRFIYPGNVSTVSTISVKNSYWAGTTPSDLTCIKSGGNLELSGNVFSNFYSGTSQCEIAGTQIKSENNFFTNADEVTHCVFVDGSGNSLNYGCGGGLYQARGTPLSFYSWNDQGGTEGTPVALSGWNWMGQNINANMIAAVGSGSSYPAQSGWIRACSSCSLMFRNNAGIADLNGISKDTNDVTHIGDVPGIAFQSATTKGPIQLGTAGSSGSATTAFSAMPGLTVGANNWTGTVGYIFQTTDYVTVSALGRYKYSGNTQNHEAYLWTNGGMLVASGNILNSSPVDGNGYQWVAVSPVTLPPSIISAIATEETNGGDTWANSNPATYTTTLNSQFTAWAAAVGSAASYPSDISYGYVNGIYGTANMTYSYFSPVSVVNPAYAQLAPMTFGQLSGIVACGSGNGTGAHGTVTDSTTETYGATITGGGSPGYTVPAFCNGTNWIVD